MASYGRWIGAGVLFVSLALASGAAAQAPVPPEIVRYGYPDLIIFNGKIVSMDDAGVNTNVGNTYEAMAIKNARIMALGTNQRIRALALPETKQIDLQGQTVIPGIVETHSHLFGDQRIANQIGLRQPDMGARLTIMAGKDFETTRLRIETAVEEAVKKVQPEQWIHVGLAENEEEGVSGMTVRGWLTSDVIEPKDRLDRIAPNNPVWVQNGTRANLNSKGFEIMERFVPHFKEFAPLSVGGDFIDEAEKGYIGVSVMQSIDWDLLYRNQPLSLVAEMFRRDLEMTAAYGVTTFSSRIPHPRILDGFTLLNREKALPVRFAALYEVARRPADPDTTRQFYRMTGNLMGLGDEYMWVHGLASELWDSNYPQACLGRDIEAPPKIKERELCPKPGDLWWDVLQNAMEAGWRLAGIHSVGSDGARRFIQLIETAMKNTGMTVEDVRKLRPTVEHAQVLGAIPDVVEGLKKYNIIVSTGMHRTFDNPAWYKDYGPAIDAFAMPAKTLLQQGVKLVGQGFNSNIGWRLWLFMSRNIDGKILLPNEAIDRVTVLKMLTPWAAYYVLKEQDLGTLEEGKLADFVVLDRDYFTIPQDDIPKIRPQLTFMGGKIRYLASEYAAKLGMQPEGYQFPEGYEPWGPPSRVFIE